MDNGNKNESQRIAASEAILEFCKIVAYDLNFNTEDVYWTTHYTRNNNLHILTLITEMEGLQTVIEISDEELVAYSMGIGAERVREKIRKELSSRAVLPGKKSLFGA